MNKAPWNRLPSELDAELTDAARSLSALANQVEPEPQFQARLEQQLLAAHRAIRMKSRPGGDSAMFTFRKLAPALIWIAALAIFVLVLDWAIRSLAPEPAPATRGTPVPSLQAPTPSGTEQTTSGPSYDWHGTTLYLAVPLPDSPPQAEVYLAEPNQHATLEQAIELARGYGIEGDAYTVPGELPGTTDYMITDGKQSIHVRAAGYFAYTSDLIQGFSSMGPAPHPDAEATIRAFLAAHGFTSPVRIEWSSFRNDYIVQPLAPDNLPLRYEYFSSPMLLVTLDRAGKVLAVQADLLDVQSDAAGQYGILSAQEALDELLDPNRTDGIIEGMHSAAPQVQGWTRTYPLDQALTIYGNPSSLPSVDPAKPPFLRIDAYPVIGNTSGLDQQSRSAYVKATGQFVESNGVRKFNVETWELSELGENSWTGTLQRQDGDVNLLAEDGGIYRLTDVPDEIPMPFENAFVVGTQEGDSIQWKMIDNRAAMGGGGGGGGGSGFHKLNLTGTPVPFPTQTPAASVMGQGQYIVQPGDTFSSIAQAHGITQDELMQANGITDPGTLTIGQSLVIPNSGEGPQPVEALRGLLSMTIQVQPDGSERFVYGLIANASSNPAGYMRLEGDDLEALQAYNNRPIDVWGTITVPDANGNLTLRVDRYEIPFPDLESQVLRGTQKVSEIEGQPATLFTTEAGATYAQLLPDGTTAPSLIGREGDLVQVEGISIPDETLAGYPTLRVFSASLCRDGVCGGGGGAGGADQPPLVEPPAAPSNQQPPTATVEKIELVQFASDPRYAASAPNTGSIYFQPVWRFYGHYSNGDEFEVLIQALRQEFLRPELDTFVQGG